MPLSSCPGCGGRTPSSAARCVHCGGLPPACPGCGGSGSRLAAGLTLPGVTDSLGTFGASADEPCPDCGGQKRRWPGG